MASSIAPEKKLPWLDHYDPGVPPTLEYPDATVCELFQNTVKNNGEGVALVFFGKKTTYGQLARHTENVATALIKSGIKPGHRVALILPNCPQYVISYYAVLRAGATVVPVNPLSTESELLHIVRDGNVKAAICLDLLAGRVESVRDRCREAGENNLLENTYYTSIGDFLPFPLNMLYPLRRKIDPEARKRLAGTKKLAALLNTPGEPLPVPRVDKGKDPAVLIYTGGTTGKPKGVMLTHRALVANALQCGKWVGVSPEDRLLTVLPIFHGFGMSVCMNASVIAGAASILVPRFDPEEILKNIHRHRPTIFAGVPTMYIAMINHPRLKNYNLSSLRGCFVGAAPLAPEIKQHFEKLTGSKLMEGYGLTEAVTAICCNPYKGINKTGSIGIPFPDTVIRIRDLETGERDLPPGEVGELAIQCPDMMLGYYNRPEETAAVIKKEWLFTGDLGYMDEEGYFYIVDRKKDLIITGGFNVYPREVEDVLYQHPGIRETSVIGIPDGYRGEMVKAFVTLKDGCEAGEEEIIAFCKQHLLPYKVPRRVEICGELPKTAIGKILKRALREQHSGQSD
ncbi:long-chain-fatty-acid--CoA ligase [Desulfocucumis palustris]|nr:long-chain fatty acid--CoA ligase [Desulfocucumis palustris]